MKRSRLALVGRVENFVEGKVHKFEVDGEEIALVNGHGIVRAFCSCKQTACTKPHQESFGDGYRIRVEAGFVLVELND